MSTSYLSVPIWSRFIPVGKFQESISSLPAGSSQNLHGSLNVPIEHHPTIRYMVYNGYYKVMSNIPKMGQLPTPGSMKNSKVRNVAKLLWIAKSESPVGWWFDDVFLLLQSIVVPVLNYLELSWTLCQFWTILNYYELYWTQHTYWAISVMKSAYN